MDQLAGLLLLLIVFAILCNADGLFSNDIGHSAKKVQTVIIFDVKDCKKLYAIDYLDQ